MKNNERCQNVLGSQSNEYGSRCQNVRKKILTLGAGELFTRRDITDDMEGISRSLFNYAIKNLIFEGVVKQKGRGKPRLYELIKKNVKLFSYSKTKKTEYMGSHNLFITIPRLPSPDAKLPGDFWDKINNRLKNNVQKFKRIEMKDYDVCLRETTQKVIIQSNEPIMLDDLNDLSTVCLGFVWELYTDLMQYEYWIDPRNAKNENPELFYTNMTVDQLAKSHPNPKLRIYIKDLMRDKILPADDPEMTWVQFCGTPKFRDKMWIESNNKKIVVDWKNLPSMIAQQNQGFADLKDMMGGMVYRDTQRFNMEIKLTNAIEKIEKTLSVLASPVKRVRKARKIITRPLDWWLR